MILRIIWCITSSHNTFEIQRAMFFRKVVAPFPFEHETAFAQYLRNQFPAHKLIGSGDPDTNNVDSS